MFVRCMHIQTEGVALDMFSVKAEKRKHMERMEEIEKVKKRRQEKAIEKAQHDEKMALLARERARAEFQDWENKEKEFQFHQLKARSDIRLREGRVKPIDLFYNFLHPNSDIDFDHIGILDPYLVFQGLTTKVMEELHDDIQMQLDFDRALPTHIQYWEALLAVCDWEIAKVQKKEALDRARMRGEEPPAELESGLHSSIEEDVKNLLQGKTFSKLQVLQSEIESQMLSGTAKVVEYWELVLKRIQIYKAKACLVEVHAKMKRDHRSSSPNQKVDSSDYDGKNDQPPSHEHISYEETEEAKRLQVLILPSYCMVRRLKKPLTLRMTRRYWKGNVWLYRKHNKGGFRKLQGQFSPRGITLRSGLWEPWRKVMQYLTTMMK